MFESFMTTHHVLMFGISCVGKNGSCKCVHVASGYCYWLLIISEMCKKEQVVQNTIQTMPQSDAHSI